MSETTVIHQDGENEEIAILRVDEEGVAIAAAGSVHIKLDDANGKEVRLREMNVCDPATGTIKKIRVLTSEPY